ncbi:MAG: hypothetical protein HYZ14_03995 [Bacteroidetes bacterium]|nr:hypothetical protein [Bacteroidota bacterium]
MDNLKKLQKDKSDYVFLRVRDSATIENNYCTFLVNKDSCTSMFKLALSYDFSIRYIHIGDIEYYDPKRPCSKEFFEIAGELKGMEGLFVETIQPGLDLESSDLIFYGKWNEYFFVQYLDSDFIQSFHSGLIYDVICSVFIYNCSK